MKQHAKCGRATKTGQAHLDRWLQAARIIEARESRQLIRFKSVYLATIVITHPKSHSVGEANLLGREHSETAMGRPFGKLTREGVN